MGFSHHFFCPTFYHLQYVSVSTTSSIFISSTAKKSSKSSAFAHSGKIIIIIHNTLHKGSDSGTELSESYELKTVK